MGLEPTTFGSEVRRAIHYATRPCLVYLPSLVTQEAIVKQLKCDYMITLFITVTGLTNFARSTLSLALLSHSVTTRSTVCRKLLFGLMA